MAAPRQEDTIILNVGGIKYETYLSTIAKFPDTRLGVMFSERNIYSLRPKNGNEYFIDRNGYAFRYILEFYRNEKILWSDDPVINITRKELEREIDYFQIPAKDWMRLSRESIVSAKKDAFKTALEELINVAMDNLQTEVHLTFFEDGDDGNERQYWLPAIKQWEMIVKIIEPFFAVGFTILNEFGNEIKQDLMSRIQGITCKIEDLPQSDNSRDSEETVSVSEILSSSRRGRGRGRGGRGRGRGRRRRSSRQDSYLSQGFELIIYINVSIID